METLSLKDHFFWNGAWSDRMGKLESKKMEQEDFLKEWEFQSFPDVECLLHLPITQHVTGFGCDREVVVVPL